MNLKLVLKNKSIELTDEDIDTIYDALNEMQDFDDNASIIMNKISNLYEVA